MITTRACLFSSSVLFGLVAACSGTSGGFTSDGGIPFDAGSGPVLLDTGIPQGDTGFPVEDTGAPSGDTGVPDTHSTPGQCTPNCMTDQDCADSCPAVTGALNCCDTTSGVCFTSSQNACPDALPADSGPGGDAPTCG